MNVRSIKKLENFKKINVQEIDPDILKQYEDAMNKKNNVLIFQSDIYKTLSL